MKHTTIHRQNHLVGLLHVLGELGTVFGRLCRGKRSEKDDQIWSSWKEQWLCTSIWLHVFPTCSALNPDCPSLYTTTVLFHLLLRCLQVVSRLCFLRSCPANAKWLRTGIAVHNLCSHWWSSHTLSGDPSSPDPLYLSSSSSESAISLVKTKTRSPVRYRSRF
jgi:hypothetical protein